MLKFLRFEVTAAIALLICTSATAAPLQDWRFDPSTNQLEVTVPAGITPRYSLLAQPTRIVLDLPNTQIGTVQPRGSYSGAVREIRVSQFQPNLARIVLELTPDTVLSNPQAQLQQVQESDQIVDRWTLRPVLVARAPSAKTQAVFNALRPIQTAPMESAPIETPIAQTPVAPTNDFGLPPAPPVIETAPTPSVTVPAPIESSPLPTTPAVLPPILPAAGSGDTPSGSSLLFPDAPIRSTTQSNPLQLPEVNSSLAIPNSFPPINAPTSQPTVTVPQLDQRATQPESRPSAAIEDTPVPAKLRTIEFGQPLPK
ncbi:MAG TPA: AMIN domain-containing protein [Leptolyngbya sp.]|jgi:hypothetical protein|nr:AMIN domain-containing protein [Leptolyngbya sp.]